MSDYNEVVGIFPTPVYFALPEFIEPLESSIDFLHNLPLSIDTEAETELEYGGVSADSYILDKIREI